MEKRNCKVTVRRCGGNAGKGSKQYSLAIPTKWIQAMNITPDDRDVEISFSGSSITVKKNKKEKEDQP